MRALTRHEEPSKGGGNPFRTRNRGLSVHVPPAKAQGLGFRLRVGSGGLGLVMRLHLDPLCGVAAGGLWAVGAEGAGGTTSC